MSEGEPTFAITLRFACGCSERWRLYQDPLQMNETVDQVCPEPCIPATCADCAAHRAEHDHERAYCPEGRHHAALEAAAALTNKVAG